MAHEISIREDGFAEMAYVGATPWHGLGQELTKGAPIPVWMKQAGMDWSIRESSVTFSNDGTTSTFDGKKVLYRSDTGAPLSIVSEDYKVVQPYEVLEFFRSLTEDNGMSLSTAGVLFGGNRFWALAETGREGEVLNGDVVKGNLLFITSADGSLASSAKFTSTRVVCNNTLRVALAEGGKNMVRKTHRTLWDSKQAQIDLGLLDESWDNFMLKLNILSKTSMEDVAVLQFYKNTFFDLRRADNEQSWVKVKLVNSLMNAYKNGAGADMAKGTAWGALNGITNIFTHQKSRRSADANLWASMVGNDDVKETALQDLLYQVAA